MVDADIEMPGIGAGICLGRQFGAPEFTVAVRPSTILAEVCYRIVFTMRPETRSFFTRQNMARPLQAAIDIAQQFGDAAVTVVADKNTPQPGIRFRVCERIDDACVCDLLAPIALADGTGWNKVT